MPLRPRVTGWQYCSEEGALSCWLQEAQEGQPFTLPWSWVHTTYCYAGDRCARFCACGPQKEGLMACALWMVCIAPAAPHSPHNTVYMGGFSGLLTLPT